MGGGPEHRRDDGGVARFLARQRGGIHHRADGCFFWRALPDFQGRAGQRFALDADVDVPRRGGFARVV